MEIRRTSQSTRPGLALLALASFLFAGVETFELVEAYLEDKYLPSYLVLGRADTDAFHVLFAADVEGDNVRVVTAYRPDAAEWQDDLKTRRPRR